MEHTWKLKCRDKGRDISENILAYLAQEIKYGKIELNIINNENAVVCKKAITSEILTQYQ